MFFKKKKDTVNEFPIAFNLIKPVLERTNAKQLESCEYYSPVINKQIIKNIKICLKLK